MGWMGGKTKVVVPDTSAQEAEIRRQTDALIAQMQQFMDAQLQAAADQRAEDQRRFDEQRAADLAEAERQRGVLERQLEDQRISQQEFNDRIEALRQQELATAEARAADARTYATGRSDLIDQATAQLDGEFAGFDDTYFKQFSDRVLAATRPAVDQQYKTDRRDTRLALADRGNLNSSAGARALSELSRSYKTAVAGKAGEASDLATRLRSQIEDNKRSALSGLINSAFSGVEQLPEGSDASSTLNDVSSRLNNYVRSVTESVKQYVPLAGSGSVTAPHVTAPQVSLSAPSLTGSLTGASV